MTLSTRTTPTKLLAATPLLLGLLLFSSGCSSSSEPEPGGDMSGAIDQGASGAEMGAGLDMSAGPSLDMRTLEDAGADMRAGEEMGAEEADAGLDMGRDMSHDMSLDMGGEPPAPGCELAAPPMGTVYYVATDGDDGAGGDGSAGAPFATITHALDQAEDGSTILVRPGTYSGRIRMRGSFAQGVTVRSEVPYLAKLRHDAAVLTFYKHPDGCEGITLEGFDIAHSGPGASALVVHIDGGGDNAVSRITLRDNIMHDSYNNDILKINNATTQILVERNMFYNQEGSDEHIDINSVEDVVVQDNVFFNDFEGSGRTNGSNTSSYIVIKDSNGDQDLYTGSSNVRVQRNLFLNWQGDSGTGFLLIGEDGKPFFEGFDIHVENNLFLGNSSFDMRAPFGVKGGRDISFRHNTIVGDLPSRAYAMRLNTEGSNPPNERIAFYNNIWSDPTGSMGQLGGGGGELDFSDTRPEDVASFTLSTNLYWNGGLSLPDTGDDAINPADDPGAVQGDPALAELTGPLAPRWVDGSQRFVGGASSICEVHRDIVEQYGSPGASSAAIGAADPAHAPAVDILRRPREASTTLGAVEAP